MILYAAPMEGLTGYVFRQVHHKYFGGIDQYFTPFLSPGQNHCFSHREMSEILPEHNQEIPVVPQLLTRNWEDFLWAEQKIAGLGYQEVNLNLGCPSGTVTAKGKGAGFLRTPQDLDRFLDQICSLACLPVSVKTRIGVESREEWPALLEIFNRYPLKELIVHPRLRRDFYKNTPDRPAFLYALEYSANPLCYNGDLFSRKAAEDFLASLPAGCPPVALMLGRGLLMDPSLARQLKGGKPLEKEELKDFCRELYDRYRQVIPGETQVLFKMKELWTYLGAMFQDGEKLVKKIKKAKKPGEYETAVENLFHQSVLLPAPKMT